MVVLDGTDGYYHLRRSWLVAGDWPRVIQFDHLMSVPDGARVQWPPLFDFLLGSVARALPGEAESTVTLLGAILPVILGALQVLAMFLLLVRLAGPRAAAWGAVLAAVVPGVVRYGLLGALDHDPLIELEALLVLAGLAGALTTRRWRGATILRCGAEIALPLAALMLTWAGAVIHVGLFTVVTMATAWAGRRSPRGVRQLGSAVALGAGGAALLVLPFVLGSVWTATDGATFAGLSWLQEAALLGLACVGGVVAWCAGPRHAVDRWILGVTSICGVGLMGLLPAVVAPLREGLAFLGRSEPFLEALAESRPLLTLFGQLDLRPLLVRLSAVPLAYPVLLPWLLRQRPRWRGGYVSAWGLYTLAVALVQSRYSHAAALAAVGVVSVAGSRWVATSGSERSARGAVAAVALLLLPCSAAYLRVPGLEPHRMFGRTPPLTGSGYQEVCRFLAVAAPPSRAWRAPDQPARRAVLAPWEAGHWLQWLSRQATVVNPFGPQGQPGFRDGVRFYFLDDEQRIVSLLRSRRVRWIVVDSDLVKLEHAALLAGRDPVDFLGATSVRGLAVKTDPLMRTIGGRLAFAMPLHPGPTQLALSGGIQLTEVFRTSGIRSGPFGPVPLIRVYEVSETTLEGDGGVP